ncbi:MAG: long-chain fatty acid--CoA ligase [Deltaproteobacteria bacterium]|nr:long-chain fatty acid--CoA ligase [Deltaproteobacteria bacterium]
MHHDPADRLSIPDVPLFRLLEDTAARHPDYIALTVEGENITYGELLGASRAFASGLREQGVKRGDRVGLILPNIPQYAIAFFGILRAGGVVVNLSVMTPGEGLLGLLQHAGAVTAVTADVFARPLLEAAGKSGLQKLVLVPLSGKDLPRGGAGAPDCVPFDALFRDPSSAAPAGDFSGDDPAVIQYTSGTTGRPKGVVLTHRNLVANVLQIDRAVDVSVPGNGATVCVIPFFHVFGMTVCLLLSVYNGYRMILVPRFDWSSVLSILEIIETYRPVSFPAVSSLWAALVSHPEAAGYPLDVILVPSGGGSPVPAWVQERFKSLTGRNIMEAFGLSEASSTTHMNPLDRVVPGSIGVPVPGTEARIVDMEDGKTPCEAGRVGELIVRGPQVMKGYWRDEELTNRTLRNGWLYTGDLAATDENGIFYIVDRKDDLIISSGFNVYPSEIEDVLAGHPGIRSAAVVGAEDRLRGQAVKAFVVPETGGAPTREELLDFCRTRLAGHKVPKVLVFTEEIPHSPTGKPLRRALRGA